MTIVKAWAEFQGNLPHDMIEDDGEIIQFGGRNVAEIVAEKLRALGATVDEPEYEGDHGWTLSIRFMATSFFSQVTSLHPKYLLLVNRGARYDDLYDPVQAYMMAKLGDALDEDPRFHDILWYGYSDYDKHLDPSPKPVVGEVPDISQIVIRPSLLDRFVAWLRRRPVEEYP